MQSPPYERSFDRPAESLTARPDGSGGRFDGSPTSDAGRANPNKLMLCSLACAFQRSTDHFVGVDRLGRFRRRLGLRLGRWRRFRRRLGFRFLALPHFVDPPSHRVAAARVIEPGSRGNDTALNAQSRPSRKRNCSARSGRRFVNAVITPCLSSSESIAGNCPRSATEVGWRRTQRRTLRRSQGELSPHQSICSSMCFSYCMASAMPSPRHCWCFHSQIGTP